MSPFFFGTGLELLLGLFCASVLRELNILIRFQISDYESKIKYTLRHTIIIRRLIYRKHKWCVLWCTSHHPLTRVGWSRRSGPASSGSAEAWSASREQSILGMLLLALDIPFPLHLPLCHFLLSTSSFPFPRFVFLFSSSSSWWFSWTFSMVWSYQTQVK